MASSKLDIVFISDMVTVMSEPPASMGYPSVLIVSTPNSALGLKLRGVRTPSNVKRIGLCLSASCPLGKVKRIEFEVTLTNSTASPFKSDDWIFCSRLKTGL